MNVSALLKRAQPGSHASVRAHIRRGEAIAEAIQERWPDIHVPHQWKAKHLRWALEVWAEQQGFSPATHYDYWRTARAIAGAVGHWPDWEPHIRGPWCRPDGGKAPRGVGGRPPKLSAKTILRKP